MSNKKRPPGMQLENRGERNRKLAAKGRPPPLDYFDIGDTVARTSPWRYRSRTPCEPLSS